MTDHHNDDADLFGLDTSYDTYGPYDEPMVGPLDAPDKPSGFHPVNVGRLSTGTGGIVPCTPLGVTMLLDSVIDDLTGLDVVVIGKSNIVGKPIAMLLARPARPAG